MKSTSKTLAAAAVAILSTACRQDMHDQPRYSTLEASAFFNDGMSARPLVEGTVARGHLRDDDHRYTGRVAGEPAKELPYAVTRVMIERGRERFDIFCSPCHGRAGDGMGAIVQRGLRQPPSFHTPRLREIPPGHIYDVITSGFGAMYSYASRIPVDDRWAIVAYVRALQLSQNATVNDVPPDQRSRIEEPRP